MDEINLSFDEQVRETRDILNQFSKVHASDGPEYFTVTGLFGDKDNEQFNICQRAEKYCQSLFPYLYKNGESTPWRWKCSVRVPEDRVYVKENLVWLFNRVYKLNLNEKKPTPPTGYKHVRNRVAKMIEVLSEIVKDDDENQMWEDIKRLRNEQSGLTERVSQNASRLEYLENTLSRLETLSHSSNHDESSTKRLKLSYQSLDNDCNHTGELTHPSGIEANGFITLLQEKFKDEVFFYNDFEDASGYYCIAHVNTTSRVSCDGDAKDSRYEARADAFKQLVLALDKFYVLQSDYALKDITCDIFPVSNLTKSSNLVSVYESHANDLLDKHFVPNVASCNNRDPIHTVESCLRATDTSTGNKPVFKCAVSVNATKTLCARGCSKNDAARNLLQRIEPDSDGIYLLSGFLTEFHSAQNV